MTTSPRIDKGSLERGLSLLRLFKPGVSSLGNGELAERSGMARSTITRITHQMVEYGFLIQEPGTGAFRLGPVVLSLAEAYNTASPLLRVCHPLLEETAMKYSIDINLSMLDDDDMVYIESVRHRKETLERRVRAGHRIPFAMTSAGKALLASLPDDQFQQRLEALPDDSDRGRQLRAELIAARQEFATYGYSTSQWMTSLTAMATPFETANRETLYVGFGIALSESTDSLMHTLYGPALLDLARKLQVLCSSSPDYQVHQHRS